MNPQRLNIIYNLDCVSPLEVWNLIYDKLNQENLKDNTVSFYGKKLSIDEISKLLIKNKKPYFRIETEDMIFNFSTITNYKHILVTIEIKKNGIVWFEWIDEFLKLEGFIQAWITDIEYDYWQNAADPLEYTSKGRSIEGLPMKSNGLPYPLEQLVVDTSRNPARREIRVGYVAAIGNPMWIGKSFWQYSANSKESVMKELREKAAELKNGII